jgi:hypothetical protein
MGIGADLCRLPVETFRMIARKTQPAPSSYLAGKCRCQQDQQLALECEELRNPSCLLGALFGRISALGSLPKLPSVAIAVRKPCS